MFSRAEEQSTTRNGQPDRRRTSRGPSNESHPVRSSFVSALPSVGLAAVILVGCGDDDDRSSSYDTITIWANADASAARPAS